jgi:hypothetical protein
MDEYKAALTDYKKCHCIHHTHAPQNSNMAFHFRIFEHPNKLLFHLRLLQTKDAADADPMQSIPVHNKKKVR